METAQRHWVKPQEDSASWTEVEASPRALMGVVDLGEISMTTGPIGPPAVVGDPRRGLPTRGMGNVGREPEGRRGDVLTFGRRTLREPAIIGVMFRSTGFPEKAAW